jgi:hypothetical protein
MALNAILEQQRRTNPGAFGKLIGSPTKALATEAAAPGNSREGQTEKLSSVAPEASLAVSHFGFNPRPDQECPVTGSRYFAATLVPPFFDAWAALA